MAVEEEIAIYYGDFVLFFDSLQECLAFGVRGGLSEIGVPEDMATDVIPLHRAAGTFP